MSWLDESFVAAGVLLFISVSLSRVIGKTGIPALLIFLVIGMLAGSDGIGGIYFDNYAVTQAFGITALMFILFSGGLDTRIKDIRPVLRSGLLLSTQGVVLSAFFVGAFAKYFLDFSWRDGLLLGAIISSTDAAAVFSVLRSKAVGLNRPLKPLLEFESGSNDPMSVFLTVGILSIVDPTRPSIMALGLMFFRQMIFGGLLGWALGKLAVLLINKLKLQYEGLYPALSLSIVVLTYGVTQAIGGSGFLAVYLAGLVVGNSRIIHRSSLLRFHDGLAWIMQIIMFLLLGLLVFPKELVPLIPAGVALVAFLMFVARPLSVYLALLPFGIDWRQMTMVSWGGLRGAVPIILATYPFLAELPQAKTIFNLVFFVVLVSVALQGTTISFLAKLLKVKAPMEVEERFSLEHDSEVPIKGELTEIPILEASKASGKTVLELRLPAEVRIVLIHRGNEELVPSGNTVLEAGDRLLIFADSARIEKVKSLVG